MWREVLLASCCCGTVWLVRVPVAGSSRRLKGGSCTDQVPIKVGGQGGCQETVESRLVVTFSSNCADRRLCVEDGE